MVSQYRGVMGAVVTNKQPGRSILLDSSALTKKVQNSVAFIINWSNQVGVGTNYSKISTVEAINCLEGSL